MAKTFFFSKIQVAASLKCDVYMHKYALQRTEKTGIHKSNECVNVKIILLLKKVEILTFTLK